MGRVFNTTGVCIPEKHYMVNINGRLQQIRVLVDEGKYFTINRARQYLPYNASPEYTHPLY